MRQALRDLGIGNKRLLQARFLVHGDERIVKRVEPVDAPEKFTGELGTGNLFPASMSESCFKLKLNIQ